MRWTSETNGEWKSGKSVLVTRQGDDFDDDDDDDDVIM